MKPSIKLPTVSEITEQLTLFQNDTDWTVVGWDTDGNETPNVDVRLQVSAHGWNVHVGDSSYDQDHSGYWGSAYLSRNDTADTLEATAADLIEQVAESIAMSDTHTVDESSQ